MNNIKDLDIELFEGDLRNSNNFGEMFLGCEGLFHLAADYRLWAKNPTELYRVNCDGTKAIMLSAAKAGVSRIVYTSSVATLGLVPGGEANEETPVKFEDMIGNYKKSKFLAEKFVKELCLSEGVPIVIVNPTTPIGPRDIKPTPTGRMVLEAAAGKIPAYVETGLNLVHVDDVAKGHILAYEKGSIGEKYILGGQNLEFSEKFYNLYKNKYNICYEDRDIRLGQKLSIFDLIGLPVQLIIGEKNINDNNVEVKDRKSGKVSLINKDQIEVYLKKNYEL